MKQGSVITIDLGASKIRFAAVNDRYELTQYLDVPPVDLVGSSLDNKKLIGILADGIRKTSADLIKENCSPAAISIGSPGPLNPFKGIIEETPNLKGIKNLPIVEELKNTFNLPTFLLNDADAAGLGELWVGAGRNFSDVDYITLSSGVGSAKISDGKLERGLGKASEWGHTSIGVPNKWWLCGCGQWSCAEAYLGTHGLSKIYAKIFDNKETDLSEKDIYSVSYKMREGIAANYPKWIKVQEEYAQDLAILLRNIILVDQPQIIILGGGIAYGNESLLSEAKKQLTVLMDLKKDKMAVMAQGVKIKLAQLKNAVNFGAAKYALEEMAK